MCVENVTVDTPRSAKEILALLEKRPLRRKIDFIVLNAGIGLLDEVLGRLRACIQVMGDTPK